MAVGHFRQALLSDTVCRRLGPEVAPAQAGRARVGADDVQDVCGEPDRRDDQAFLPQVTRGRGHGSGGHPTQVGVVGPGDAVCHDPATGLDGA